MVVAIFVLTVIPWDPSTHYEWRITPAGFRAIAVLWFLAVVWLVMFGVFRLFGIRQMGPTDARVYARSTWCRQMRRELDWIEKRRARKIRRAAGETVIEQVRQ